VSEPNDGDDEAQRNRANLFAAIAVLLIAAGAFWLIKTLNEHRRIEDCLASGRRDCLGSIEPAAGPAPAQ
jgi:hypothetical protein